MTFHLFKLFHPGSLPPSWTLAIHTRGTKTPLRQPAILAHSLVGSVEGTDIAAFIFRLTRPMVVWERNAGIANRPRRHCPNGRSVIVNCGTSLSTFGRSLRPTCIQTRYSRKSRHCPVFRSQMDFHTRAYLVSGQAPVQPLSLIHNSLQKPAILRLTTPCLHHLQCLIRTPHQNALSAVTKQS